MLHSTSETHNFELGRYESKIRARLDKWRKEDTCRRIWDKDYTVWSPTPTAEITDRLGWLHLPQTAHDAIEPLKTLAREVSTEGFSHVVLLGMGGSSLAPEVFQAIFGNAEAFPELVVLDSTHPERVLAVEAAIDLEKTIFLIASKSGTTAEPLSFFKYFWGKLSGAVRNPGQHLIATTDPGTSLEQLARECDFRHVFTAPPDVGGRYSALSSFGLAPAALIGITPQHLLAPALTMAKACKEPEPELNPGLALGAALGELALAGRDKVTFMTSPSLIAFPDWLEQLIAESTGKDGKGIVPIAGEEPASPEAYGADRFFVYLRLADEADTETEGRLQALSVAGHPAACFTLRNKLDLGAEMFRWEMAVAAAGSVLGIHPFNQPDVQMAKELARKAMTGAGSHVPAAETISVAAEDDLRTALSGLLTQAGPHTYVAIQAYLNPTRIRKSFKLATTVGFGPRFLHSTGQIHKGGPATGLFIQLIDAPSQNLRVPETTYTFADLIRAQALGDYRALQQRGRRVIRVSLGGNMADGLKSLEASLD
jgi:transaldolase/glucose-6-phosphate isomerase